MNAECTNPQNSTVENSQTGSSPIKAQRLTKKKELVRRWIEAYDAFKPGYGIPIGARLFDEWLIVYLQSRAAMLIQSPQTEESLLEALHKARLEEIKAHNNLRPKDIHWQRSHSFMQEQVARIVQECVDNECLSV